MTRYLALSAKSTVLYLAEFNWRYTELGGGDEFVPPTLQPPPKGWEFPLKSKQYLHVNPTSGWKSKNWTVEKWARTIDTLTKIGIGPIVMTSGAQDWQKEHRNPEQGTGNYLGI
jgi:ADP-heptose:LPS heptosyltransferase